jgi:hypothetical protein
MEQLIREYLSLNPYCTCGGTVSGGDHVSDCRLNYLWQEAKDRLALVKAIEIIDTRRQLRDT